VNYLFNTYLTTGRNEFLYFFITTYFLAIFLMRKYGVLFKNFIKFAGLLVLSVVSLGFLFWLLGSNRANSLDFSDTFAVYFASPLFALNNFLSFPVRSSNFGQETLYLFYKIIRLFSNLPVNYSFTIPLDFTSVGPFQTNIYTAIRRYVADFGFFGALVIQIIFILFYDLLFKLEKKLNSIYFTVFAASVTFPIIEFFIEERFLVNVIFNTQTIYIVLFLIILYFIDYIFNVKLRIIKI
jgi:oligosaccharide repeat unit polymerase